MNPSSTQRKTAVPPRHLAVIELGTTSIRMAVAETQRGGRFQILESVQQAVALGRDAFTRGRFERETIEDCVRTLRGFRQLLREYGIVDPAAVTAVATSAVREAANRDALLDRIYVATGIDVRVIDEAEVSRYTYRAVRPLLEQEPFWRTSDTLVIEVGGGSTEALTFLRGRVSHVHLYRLGSLRLRKMLEDTQVPAVRQREIMQSQIDAIAAQIMAGARRSRRLTILALGGDARFACAQLLPDWDQRRLARLAVRDLTRLTYDVLRHSTDDLVQRHRLSYAEAETLGPALLFYVRLARAAGLNHILVCPATLRNGVLAEQAAAGAWTEEFRRQIFASAAEVGRKYGIDAGHSQYVARLSARLFRLLRADHHLDARAEMILALAALLHEAGQYVSRSSHHKHSLYLIMHSDLFGLGRDDTLLVALVARYHRRALPQPTHEFYATLDRDRRILVCKLAAILRVADALDCGHAQRIAQPELRLEQDTLWITARGADSLAVEQHRLRDKAQLFEQVYGIRVALRGA